MKLLSTLSLLFLCTLQLQAQLVINGKRIKPVEVSATNAVGHVAPNFTTKDVNGKPVTLSNFKGKYLLLDFWASWCVPCRASTPTLVKAYNKYHVKGFEVIAIADNDHQEKKWTTAIKQDKTGMWVNVLRGAIGVDGNKPDDINNKYGVSLLPTRILIDKDGVIVGRYTGTDEVAALDKKLAEIFGK